MEGIFDRLKGFVPQFRNRGVAIFPYGNMGHRVERALNEAWNIEPLYRVDNYSKEHGVISLRDLEKKYKVERFLIILAVVDYVTFRQLLPELFQCGIDARDIVLLRKDYLLSYEAVEWLINHHDDYCTVLDVGCGEGLQGRFFADYGFEVTGLTMSSQNGYAGECLREPSRVIKKDFFHYEGNCYDVVWASHILEHIPVPDDFLRHVRKVLRPEGCLALTVPNDERNISNSHVHTFNAGRLLRYLLCAGFDCYNAQILAYGFNLSIIIPHVSYIEEELDVEAAQTSANIHGSANNMFNYLPEGITVLQTWNHVNTFCGDIQELGWEHGRKIEI